MTKPRHDPQTILVVGSLSSSLKNFRGHLIEDMVRSGHDVHVAAPELIDDLATSNWLTLVGATAHDISLSRTGLSPVEDAKALFHLYRLMRRIRPGTYLGYTIKPVIWGLIAAWIAKVPKRVAMITGLGYAFTGEAHGKRLVVQKVVRFLYATAMRKANLVFFQNPDDLTDFEHMSLLPTTLPRQIINGSGVDIEHFQPVEFPNPPMRFLMIARLLGDKGVREYAAAATNVKRNHPEAKFDLVGPIDPNPDGITEQEIRIWSEKGVIKWHGPTNDVRPFIANAHVYVLPSYREGTPRTVLEAMAMGRAIITTDAPGCRETVIHNGNGLLVQPRNAEALTAAMLAFVEDAELHQSMGKRSTEIVKSKYDVRLVNKSILRAIGKLPPKSKGRIHS
nr:glycosyltransferase family 4 protein [Oceanococcus sp. HetDA_MAG_MS8]